MSKKKLKICHIITRMIIGGAQENTVLSVLGQLNTGHDVTLITGPSTGPEGSLLDKNDYYKILSSRVIVIHDLIREICPVSDIKAYIKIKKILKDKKFDVVHTHSSKAGVIGRAAAWKVGCPYIVHTVHGQAFHKYEKAWKNAVYKLSEKWAAKRCHKIYAVAQAMIDQCIKCNISSPDKYKVVYSGMKIDNYLNSNCDISLKKKLNIPENYRVVGAIARLFPLKGYDYLISSSIEILKDYPNTIFLIVGDGSLKKDLEKQIIKEGIEKNFVFAGLISPDEVYRYTSIMDMLVHLSLREGLPRAVVQALASGKPAIAFNLDGTPEVVINNKTGFVCEPKNISQVIDSIKYLLNNPETAVRFGMTGRDLVKDKFDWKVMVNTLLEDYMDGSNKN